MTTTKRPVAIVVAIAIVFSMIPALFGAITVDAAGTGVQAKLDKVKSVYGTGSYFTVSGSACPSSNHDTVNGVYCQGCLLNKIPARGGLPAGSAVGWGDADTCHGFALYVYYCVYGQKPADTTSWNKKSGFVLGDIVRINEYHSGIYLSEDSNYYYLYDANGYGGGKNKVTYKSAYPKNKVTNGIRGYHAPNYDTINNTATTYTITYNANGGTGAPATGKKTQGVNYTVPSTVPTRTGYKFVGWAKGGPTDTTVYVKPGGTISANSAVTLYAIWQSNKLNVTYNANGGKISSDTYYVGSGNDVYKVSNSSKFVVTYPKNTSGSYSSITDPLGQNGLYDCATFGISKEGYKFAGWSKTKDGSGTIYSQTDATLRPVDISSDVKTKDVSVTLYAIWVSNKINISYNANGGTITSDTYYDGSNGDVYKKSTSAKAVYTYPKNATGSNSTVNDPLSDTGLMNAKTFGLSKSGYKFVGWSKTKDGSDKTFDQDDTALRPVDISSDVKTKDVSLTLYAVWKKTSTFTGLKEAADGNWYCYRNGEIDYSENCIIKNEYGYWKCTNGKVDFNFTGMDWSRDFEQYLYCVNGKVDFDYYGFQFYSWGSNEPKIGKGDAGDRVRGWYYIRGGREDLSFNGIEEGTGITWIDSGRLLEMPSGWFRVENGMINHQASGVFQNNYGWWYVDEGFVHFNYTGIAQNEYGWWRIVNGGVDFGANGVYQNEYGWWKVTNGQVDFSYTGVAQNDYGWWRIENGQVNFNFNGIASNEYGRWYLEGGKVDFSKNGTITYNGKTYKIKNGKVV